MGGTRNEYTGDNTGMLIQAGSIEYLHVERACARPLDVGDIRVKDELPRTLDLGNPLCLGREKELDRLAEALAEGRNVQLFGPAGIGKTTLLRHAAHRNLLTVPDMQAIVWTASLLPDADEILRAVLDACCDFPADRPIPSTVLRQAMTGLRALVIIENPRCPAAELAAVLGAMPRSVFVVATDRSDLRGGRDVRVLLAGLPVKASRELLRSRFDQRLPAAVRQQVTELCAGYGQHPGKVALLGDYLAQARQQNTLPEGLGPDETKVIVPRLIGWLAEHPRAAVLTLAALENTEWGWPLLATVAEIPTQATVETLRGTTLLAEGERFRLAAGIAGLIPAELRLDVEAVTGRITSWVTETVDAQQVAAEIMVIEQALQANLDADRHDVALALARAAATKLVSARHWGAWGRVLALGLQAALGADSVRDQVYFRYSIAARKYADGKVEEAFELVVALMSDGLDTVDDVAADRIRRLADQVGYRGDAPTEQVTGLLGLLRQAQVAAMKVPAPVQQFVVSHPQVLRVAGAISLVSALVAALLTSSSHPPTTAAEPNPGQPVVVDTTTPGSSPTTGFPGGPTTTGASTTAGATPIGDPITSGGRPGPTTGNGNGGGPGPQSPPPTTLSWGFARDDHRRTDGQPDDLTAYDPATPNYQANWTWGIWMMQSPPSAEHPTGTRLGTGRQRIRMPLAGTPGGTVTVTALDTGATGSYCQPEQWRQDGAAEIVDVRCFTRTGAVSDVPFLVFFAAGSGANPIAAPGTRSYVVDDQPGATAFAPDWQHGRNAGQVVRTGVGRYTAELAGAATGVVELAAIGSAPRHCSIAGRHGDSVDVACVDTSGAAADTAFAASAASGQNLLDDNRKLVGDYVVTGGGQWGLVTFSRTATGKYTARLGNGYSPSTMHVTAEGVGNYCALTGMNETTRNDSYVYLACYAANGTLTDTNLDLLYTSTRIY
ncbi:ATP-binding protein [Kutzneria kofuensis]|uniref:Uncharacterized protein n=1 Tax=Kutzneria kofuensis TaxID=103725 RepID=A0A7W9KLQ6_9PSEU|nr:ATP-binding protein [Kutzneria kofuensis]MBB5894154.1 hypothetical protein [Kutzneria kofuensis]